MNNKRTWIVLGATGVIGRAFARLAAQEGNDVILTGKSSEDMTLAARDVRARYPDVDVSVVELDTGDLESFPKTVAQCEETAKNIISVF
ncbi:MAG TPA: hypothetical protein DCX19_01640, partial [Alphaproteobacteria bacterium]|nr:hypothetical protein [Alphaproteobacteria bacterium]